jgi:hypothetical protein
MGLGRSAPALESAAQMFSSHHPRISAGVGRSAGLQYRPVRPRASS